MRRPLLSALRKPLVELVARSALPAMFESRRYVEDGGLMGYGPNFSSLFRRAATYVDKILKGTKPRLPARRAAHHVRLRD